MREVAALFAGMHDFRSFTAADADTSPTRVQVEQVEIASHGPLVLVRIVGSHFLWRMVRRLVGVMVASGRGELTPHAIGRMLQDESHIPAALTAPASGLFLERVYYAGDTPAAAVRPAMFSDC
jgi:tRNA pseudouridine38-40 synthase